MYILSVNMWFQKLMKQFFFGIDQIVYNAISSIYDLLIAIARTSVLTQADILDMADRIYKLLAIFMIFKVTLSLITYVVNPDDFSDKSKGVSKLSMNIVISLALLILTPYIFNMAYRLQTIILEDNSLATLIFGEEDDGGSGNFMNSAGDEIAYITMSAFFTPNTSITQLQNCINLTTDDGNVDPQCSGLDPDSYSPISDTSNTMYALTNESSKNSYFELTDLQNYVAGVNNKNLGLMFRQDIAIATDSKNTQFIMDYKYIFSTVVGVVVALLLISFCMDVALRSIKLAFLQLIAPIPILSYVDPKSGKDGMFKKWYQLCFKTYLSLFIRLLALYFAVYIISKVADMKLVDIVDGSYQTNAFIYIFVIIGALMFAKQLPKILEGLGIKLDGDGKFFLNPLRKMENQMAGGKLLKKPNDALAKFGKGVAMAPINGMGTLGKKTIGGIDSARHGKGFKAGWNRTHGKLYNSINKKLDEWAPDRAEERKNRLKGTENQEARRRRETLGEPMATNVNKVLDRRASEDGRTYKNAKEWKAKDYSSYARAKAEEEIKRFNSSEYAASYKKLAEAKIDANEKHQKAKDIDQKYQSALGGNVVTVGKDVYGDTSKKEVQEYMATHGVKVKSLDELKLERDGAAAMAASADSKVENAKREHEDVKLKHSDDSRLETAYDEYGKSHNWDYDKEGNAIGWDAASSSSSTSGSTTNSSTPNEPTETPEEKARKLAIQKQIAALRRQYEELRNQRAITPDGDEWRELGRRMREIEEQIKLLESQL